MPPPKNSVEISTDQCDGICADGQNSGHQKAQPGHRGDHTYADKIRFTYDLIVADERK